MEATKGKPSFFDNFTRSVKAKPATAIVILITLLFTVLIAVQGGASAIVNTIVTGGMWALMSAGLALVFGVMNIPHFAHGESFMVGAYVAYFVFTPINEYVKTHPSAFLSAVGPFAGMIVAMLVGFVLGAILEKLVFYPLRRRTKAGWVMNAFLLTVGVSFVLSNGALLTLGANFRGVPRYWDVEPLKLLGVQIAVDRLVAFVVAVIAIMIFWLFLQRTRTGRAIRAVSQDETGAQIVGINLNAIHTLTFSLATALAALSGATLLFMFPAYPTVGLKPLYFAWYVVMLVGLGNVAGAILGGFMVAVLQAVTQQFVGIAWEDVVPVAVMIIVLVLVPSGIFGSEVKGIQEQ
jgi:branched-chain amino acid transport system permease protein